MTADHQVPDDVRRALYGGVRATFVERRKELAAAARRNGDRVEARRIAELRKPSAAAHLVNQLALSPEGGLHDLVELGAEIRSAMAEGNDAEMRTLLKGRSAAITRTLAEARALADVQGESVSAAVGDQIVQTLRAAMASDESAAAVRDGTLTEALDEPGFSGLSVELPIRAHGPSTAPPAKRRSRSRVDVAADPTAQQDAEHAAAAAAAAERSLAAAAAAVSRMEDALAAATKRRDGLRTERDRSAAQLAQIEGDLDAAQAELDDIESQRRDAVSELEALRNAGTR